jgi:hypothetical protein
MKKRGQFYLIATIVIVTVIIGFVTISNYSRTSFINIYDMGKELEIEGGKILDYGIYNDLNITILLESFMEDYSKYRGVNELYFVSGDINEIAITGYQKSNEEPIIVNVGGEDSQITFSPQVILSETFSPLENNITLTVNNENYKFEIRTGENFYFIIIKTIEREEHIYVGD